MRIDPEPTPLSAARRIRRRLPGDEKFADPLSTSGRTPVEVMARGATAFRPGRDGVAKELGLSPLQMWHSFSEATGRGRGDLELALLFTDLVGFSAWALSAGDAATLELRATLKPWSRKSVRTRCVASRSTDTSPGCVQGCTRGRPRKLGGDHLGVDVNVAAGVGAAAKAGHVLVSDALLAEIDPDGLRTGRAKRLHARGAPSGLRVASVSRG
jgi:class 3 adenylate cyclase